MLPRVGFELVHYFEEGSSVAGLEIFTMLNEERSGEGVDMEREGL